ncbi:GNAT family N-acetyltransferase [Stenotrophomonas sp. YIM B06876]|uniref:GNAT family N-acetyltransferase n=1 Tax=Stenotrophomonas sp. YIM B06876 TaxID=3060211 RepID=UPI0027386EDC|nr:GNAT family N-acetyltransferase [Stenotrophomonas sp. YIM B06876]
MTSPSTFHIEPADYATQQALLHELRHAVFVEEQQVPAELEVDTLDPLSWHVLARDKGGSVIGTGRLTPDRRIGRMAVRAQWRGQGVGGALLQALLRQAGDREWEAVTLHAQLTARDFYVRHGFLPEGSEFEEAGIMHQTMCRRLSGAATVEGVAAAIAATTALVARARRRLLIHSRHLDPKVLDAPPVMEALRRFATARNDKQVSILVHDASVVQQAHSPLLALAQRLPSVFHFREPVDPVDRNYPSAYVLNDNGDCYFRLLDYRFDGEATFEQPSRTRPLEAEFTRMWERSRQCSELRALGI